MGIKKRKATLERIAGGFYSHLRPLMVLKEKGHPGGLNASELEPLAPPWQDQLRRTASPELMAFHP